MRFDAYKGDRGEVYDANGVLIQWAIRGDTTTGLVECTEVDDDGVAIIDKDGNIVTSTARHPAPLFIKPLPYEN